MGQHNHLSPLRYPGGKSSLFDFLSKLLRINKIQNGHYAEAFAGGAGAAIKLLLTEQVSKIFLNDKDIFVYSFWKSVKEHPEELMRLVKDTPVNMEVWNRNKSILQKLNPLEEHSTVELGFTAFFMNRCNRSGILTAGPIGGKEQKGNWKIDARFNKIDLLQRIDLISKYSSDIYLYNCDAIEFIKKLKLSRKVDTNNLLIYLDPPYVVNGKELYQNYFDKKDHTRFAKFINRHKEYRWIISYDDDPLIHQLYKEAEKNIFEFNYFANQTKVGRELIISSNKCQLPLSYSHYSKEKAIKADCTQLKIVGL